MLIYHVEPSVENLGPGKRFSIWVQGCSFGCEGCLVPDSWDKNKGTKKNIDDICDDILSQKGIEGITISGGEPFEQIDEIYTLIRNIKTKNPKLTIMIFTGFLLENLKKVNNNKILYIINNCDILVDGKFQKEDFKPDPWRGSANQKIHFLSNRYSIDDYIKAYKNISSEYHIKNGGGEYFVSGIPYKERN